VSGKGIVKYVKVQRIKLWGHFNRMEKQNSEEDYGMESHRNEIQRMSKNS
jgi:hypothetical protein